MTAQTNPTLSEELQLEFPSLDSSLIAAFVSERDPETLTKRQRRKLRRILAELATGADHDQQLINDALLSPPSTHVDGSSLSSGAIDRRDETTASSSIVTDAASPLASPRSSSSTASFSSPLGFLRAAFPGVPLSHLERVITDTSCDEGSVDGVDIERAIQLLLAEEYPRDLREDVNSLDVPIVKAKGKKRKDKLQTFAVNDVRQRSRTNAESRQGSHLTMLQMYSDVDIWTSISSISAQLAALLPPHPESFFRSFFHSQESKTPSTAVRRALTDITNARDGDVPPLDMTVLLTLQDIIRSTSEYNELSADDQEQILSDTHLCLHAVGSQVDNTLDLVWFLHGLDADEAAGRKTAPYHQEPHFLETSENAQPSTSETHLGPRSGRPPGRRPSQSQDDWSVVSSRKRPTGASHHGVAILLSDDSHGTATDEVNLVRDEDPARLKQRCDDLKSRLREASMLAAKAWKGGNSKNVGRQVALYHIEEVHRLQEELKDAELAFARARVSATKKSTSTGTTIDLHYTTAAQAVILAKEFLRACGASEACPMKIITGRGNHSVGGIAVLGPAVYDALKNDGWNASRSSGFLLVHGRLND